MTLDGQHGAYTFRHARSSFGDGQVRSAVESGELIGFGRGVLLDSRRVLDLRTRCAGALLLTGGAGVIVGPSAAALHGCPAAAGFPVHVRVPYSHRIRSRIGLVVHQGPPVLDATIVDGLRVVPLAEAAADLLCGSARRSALACADQALSGLRAEDRADFVADVRDRLAGRFDRRGTRQAEVLLSLASGLPETAVQSGFVLMLAECGFPRPVCQYPVRDVSGRARRLDFAWPSLGVGLEILEGDSAACVDGWEVVEADGQDLVDPSGLCRRLRAALRPREVAA
jgi:hypothetical protein